MVLNGTWWAATGAKWDPEHTKVPVKPGTYVVHTGREVHYNGARSGNENAIVMIFGQGPGYDRAFGFGQGTQFRLFLEVLLDQLPGILAIERPLTRE